MKSKVMAVEVKRLQHALHCFAAENVALRQSLIKAKAPSAPLPVQESAVLFAGKIKDLSFQISIAFLKYCTNYPRFFSESLLLGSLYWLVSIVCLFLAPWVPLESSGAKENQESTVGGVLQSTGSQPRSISKNRRCRALRTRMKGDLIFCSPFLRHSIEFLF